MARGRLLKTKVKEAKKIAEAEEIGRLMGEFKANQKIMKKEGAYGFVKNKVLKTVENMDIESTIQAVVFGSTAFTVYSVISSIESVVNQILDIAEAIGEFFFNPNVFFANLFKELSGQPVDENQLALDQSKGIMLSVSLLIAYLLVYKTDAIGRAMQGGLNSITGLLGFLGIGVSAPI